MRYSNWHPGIPIPSPVYLDANVLVGATITKHRLYAATAQFIAETLASRTRILVSLLTVQESLWAIARISYFELANQPPGGHFTQGIYQRWHQRIFTSHGRRFAAISRMLNQWVEAGVDVSVVPNTDAEFLTLTTRTPSYMETYAMVPADAAHLAVAELYASSFVTADSDFEQVAEHAQSPLEILHLTS